jgi:hypothetical protein
VSFIRRNFYPKTHTLPSGLILIMEKGVVALLPCFYDRARTLIDCVALLTSLAVFPTPKAEARQMSHPQSGMQNIQLIELQSP